MTLFISLSMCLSLLFLIPLILQPLSLGLSIILLTGSLCILSSLFVSSWYSYILFLVFVGGLLVIFAYVAVLAPNTFFLNANPIIWLLFVFTASLASVSTFYTNTTLTLSHPSYSSSPSLELSSTGSDLIFTSSTSLIIILGIFLLVALLAVVNICYYQQGPLRAHSHNTN